VTRHDLIAADFRHHCHGACCASCRQPASYADRLPQYRLPSRPTTKPDLCLAFSTRSAGSSSPKQPVARLSSEQSRQRALATFPIAPEQPAPSFNPASMRSPPTTQRVARLGPRPHRTLKIIKPVLIQAACWRRRPAGMATSLSVDLRRRVVAAVEGGMSRREATAHFRVAVSSAIRRVAQAHETGEVTPKPQAAIDAHRRSKRRPNASSR